MRCTPLLLLSALAAPLLACEPVVEPSAEAGGVAPRFVAQRDEWGPAVRVSGSSLLNTAALEGCPSESSDGRSLFFASNRDAVTVIGDIDIYVSRRQSNGEWGDPVRLPDGPGGVNSDANDYCPTALPDGRLLFVSERDDGLNCNAPKADMYETRLHPSEGWLEPEHLGCVVNSAGNEFSPSYVGAAGGMLFFSSDQGGKHAIYVSHRGPGGAWQSPEPVGELNLDDYNAVRPNVSQDGREIVFDSDRPGSRGFDVWYSHRATPHSDWSAPVKLPDDVINSAANETRASLSRDGKRLYFGSNRDGVSFDIFVAERR